MQDLGRLFFPKKYVGGCHFIKQVQEKQTENSFREVVSTREVNREKCIFWAQNFSGALRNTWKIFRGLYGSVFEPEQFLGLLRKRTPGHNCWFNWAWWWLLVSGICHRFCLLRLTCKVVLDWLTCKLGSCWLSCSRCWDWRVVLRWSN